MTTKTKKLIKKKDKTRKKIYGLEDGSAYNIHKATILSYDPLASCKMIKHIFGNEISGIQSVPDKSLSKRNIKWVRFKHGAKSELHFVEPFNLKHTNLLKIMVEEEETQSPLNTPFFENHIGINIPDLTNIILNTISISDTYILTKREDGLYQLYINIPYALDYLEIDSINIDIDKVKKRFPNFKITSFAENTNYVSKLIKENSMKHDKGFFYRDPKHNGMPRVMTYTKDGRIIISGRDTEKGKIWKVTGVLDGNDEATIDFSPKGGPKKIKAYITTTEVKFTDGNIWKRDTKLKYI